MAELAEQPRTKGVKKNKKLSTRVDLTPMVDLGFLLITFFVFTTSISEPTAMKLIMPKDAPATPLKESEAVTMVLGEKDMVYYYAGLLEADGSNVTRASLSGFREWLINRRKSAPEKNLMVVIKPQQGSLYKNTVDALDEMMINDVKSYAIVDVTERENRLIADWR
jgi:biopolymer transport protein ExbD